MLISTETIKNIVKNNSEEKDWQNVDIDNLSMKLIDICKSDCEYKYDMIHFLYFTDYIMLFHITWQFDDEELAKSFLLNRYDKLIEKEKHNSYGFKQNTHIVDGGRLIEVFSNDVIQFFSQARICVSLIRIGKFVHKVYISDSCGFLPERVNIVKNILNHIQSN